MKLARVFKQSHLLSSTFSTTTTFSEKPVKSLQEIPGPKGLPLLGTSLEYARLKEKAYKLLFKRVKKYGKIYKEKMLSGYPMIVCVCDTADVETVFRSEGKYPLRDGLPIMHKIREKLRIPKALILSSNEEWWHQRQPISQFMMVPRKIGEYHERLNEVSEDLIKAIKTLRHDETALLSDVSTLLFKWSFESVGYFTLGKRLGALNIGNVPKDCQDFIDNTQILLEGLQKTVFDPPFYKIYPTKLWKQLMNSQDQMYKLAMSFMEEKISEVETLKTKLVNKDEDIPDKIDFLTYMILFDKLTKEELTSNAIDLLFGGIDTTSYTLAWCLYSLAINPEVQVKLRDEVMKVVGDNEIVTPAHIHSMPYLRNCVKETLRLYPLIMANIRTLKNDVVLSGYKVPAGVQVLIPTLVMGRLPENFPHEPDSFYPDRWNREGEYPTNPFAFLPFGFGPRMCIGRRLAELEIHIGLTHLIKRFHIEYPEKIPMDYVVKLLIVPERQLDLIFQDITV